MDLNDLTPNKSVVEAQLVWARKGKSVSRKFRCSVGHRDGRLVSNPGQCSQPVDLKKQLVLRKTKAKMGARLQKKAKFTKRFNPASIAVRKLNKVK
jgi:hypothetical protein